MGSGRILAAGIASALVCGGVLLGAAGVSRSAPPAEIGPPPEDLPLPSWLERRASEAVWLRGTGAYPRALVDVTIEDRSETGKTVRAQIILHVPDPETAETIVAIGEAYDSCKRSTALEVGFTEGSYTFTSIRASLGPIPLPLGVVLTDSKIDHRPGQGFVSEQWWMVDHDTTIRWLTANKHLLEGGIRKCGHDAEADDYLEEIKDRIHAVSYLKGGQDYEGGFYRYYQEMQLNDPAANFFVRVSKGRQVPAALKAALMNTGQNHLNGGPGEEGAEFEVRFNGKTKKARPGKH